MVSDYTLIPPSVYHKNMTIVSDDIQRGIPRVEGSEALVIDIYDAVKKYDVPPEKVADDLNITVADVYESLAYYYRNPQEMKEARETAEQMTENNKRR